jgi:Peptidase A4 family
MLCFSFKQPLALAVSCALLLAMLPLTAFAKPSSGERAHSPFVVEQLETSTNWSGYEDRGSSTNPVTYSKVAGSWRMPSVDCSQGGTSASSFWIGLGGDAGITTLEQIGTESGCEQGQAVYYAWYEVLPAPEQKIPNVVVKPSDSLHAEVTYEGQGIFLLAISDSTQGWNFTTQQPGPVAETERGTAEWIAEDPTVFLAGGGSVLHPPLANFGIALFYDCLADGNAISSGPVIEKIVMTTDGTTNGTIKAQPVEVGSSGAAFEVLWNHP